MKVGSYSVPEPKKGRTMREALQHPVSPKTKQRQFGTSQARAGCLLGCEDLHFCLRLLQAHLLRLLVTWPLSAVDPVAARLKSLVVATAIP